MTPQLKIQEIFQTEKKNEAVKDRITRDIKNLFGHEEEDYYKPIRVGNFWRNVTIIWNLKVTVIETKPYQLKFILIEFGHI